MPIKYVFLIILTVITTAVAQTSLKIGASQAAATSQHTSIVSQMIAFGQSGPVLLGIILYALSSVFWLFVLSRLDLSLAYPFVGLGFIATMVVSYTWLGEQISASRLIGTFLIVAGCTLVARSA